MDSSFVVHSVCDRIFAKRKCSGCPFHDCVCSYYSFNAIATRKSLAEKRESFFKYARSLGIRVEESKKKVKTEIPLPSIRSDLEFAVLLKNL